MSASTPADLAVTFRSLARRQREAIGDADAGALAGLVAELQAHVTAAGATLGTTGDGDAVAGAIERRAPEDWDDATLATLRDEGLAAGAVLRRLAAAAESTDD
jgi:hypothetical protein